MKPLATASVVLVAVLHVWFFVLETLLWRTPLGLAALQMSAAESEATAILAGNQGVYNLVFAAGLGWSQWARKPEVLRFFLLAVIAVGLYGAASARLNILFIQALPAALALGLTTAASRKAG